MKAEGYKEKTGIYDWGLNVDFYSKIITSSFQEKLVNDIMSRFDFVNYRRQVYFVGDEGLKYTVAYRDKKNSRPVIPWAKMPRIDRLRKLVSKLTGQEYTVCAIGRYPSGKYGIKPHRDKEMVAGTTICGISLGETRTLVFGCNKYCVKKKQHTLTLEPGSMYVMNPPTNDIWSHCIPPDKTLSSRLSLTFRQYEES